MRSIVAISTAAAGARHDSERRLHQRRTSATPVQSGPLPVQIEESLLQIAGAALPANPLTRALPPATSLTIAAFEAAQKPVEGAAVRGAVQPTLLTSIKALQAILSVAAITRSPADAETQAGRAVRAKFRSVAAGRCRIIGATAIPRRSSCGAGDCAGHRFAPMPHRKKSASTCSSKPTARSRGQTLLQVASLPDRTDAAGTQFNSQVSDTSTQRWNFEIPFATPQGTALAQFEIERDASGNQVEATAQKVWRARFTLNLEPTGPVHALVSLVGEKTAVRMWAERPETAATIRARSGDLAQALRAAELQPGDIVVSGGAPPSGPAKAGHFLDRAS